MSMNDPITPQVPAREEWLVRSSELTDRSLPLHEITKRQLECLAWVGEGKSASDIGGILGISRRTVEGHLLKICTHLGVKTRVQALLKARDLGLIRSRTVSLLARSE
ncbi:LuxR C-terminal-related transcriptional regulator [Phenylobacterium sp.]|uniref:LuxR C-terminal-related transcriptional regulator n=1 Tax=Phenylobacterium sp. TaxID=1871053 RepID=UPI0035ADAC05